MKYAKELDRVVQCCHLMDRVFLISYRKWKKVKHLGTFWKNRFFIEMYFTPKHLIDINLKTLYKICKRFEKRGISHDSNNYYTMISKIFSDKALSTLILPPS